MIGIGEIWPRKNCMHLCIARHLVYFYIRMLSRAALYAACEHIKCGVNANAFKKCVCACVCAMVIMASINMFFMFSVMPIFLTKQ